jgi:hypothetical protein
LGVRREKQPQVLRLLAALVAQDNSLIFDADDSSLGVRREKQPQVLRLLAALVAQDDSSWGWIKRRRTERSAFVIVMESRIKLWRGRVCLGARL